MIISFSTTNHLAEDAGVDNPLFQGIKTVTRRHWTQRYFNIITSAYDENKKVHQAWDALPRTKGSKQIGCITLTRRPYWEKLQDMPVEDIYHEGNLWESKDEFIEMLKLAPETKVVVIRFSFTPGDENG